MTNSLLWHVFGSYILLGSPGLFSYIVRNNYQLLGFEEDDGELCIKFKGGDNDDDDDY